MPLKPTVDGGAVGLGVLDATIIFEFLWVTGSCGGSDRSALNNLCALPMKPFMLTIGDCNSSV